ncbi:MAG: hypothetical protein EBS38_02595 [Actinobacteria bacterium]|nr:hypothetical protein [Actinomycetota bacterium]
MKEEIFEMDSTPAKITIYGNWFLTQGDVYWRDRYFYFRLKHAYASFTEYESKNWVEEQQYEINEWGMDYPQDDVTSKEVAKLFWHLVVTKDPEYLTGHKESVRKMRELIKGEQK